MIAVDLFSIRDSLTYCDKKLLEKINMKPGGLLDCTHNELPNVKTDKEANGGACANSVKTMAMLTQIFKRGDWCAMYTAVSNDFSGRLYEDSLNRYGILPVLVKKINATAKILCLITKKPDNRAFIVCTPPKESFLKTDEISKNIFNQTRCVFLDGYCIGRSPEFLPFLTKLVKHKNNDVVFNCGHYTIVKKHRDLILDQIKQGNIDYLFMNHEEARELMPGISDLNACKELSNYCKRVIITHDKYGYYIGNGGKSRHYSLIPLDDVEDPTGAGDSFEGAFLWGHFQGLNDEKAGKFAHSIALEFLQVIGTDITEEQKEYIRINWEKSLPRGRSCR